MNEVLEWTGAACGIIGATMIASNTKVSPWGWWLFLVSSLSLTVYGLMAGTYGIMLLNVAFVMTNLLGLYRVWLPYFRSLVSKPPAPAPVA